MLAVLAPKRALCVSPGGSAPLLPFVPLPGLNTIRPGQGSRLVNRTGKPDFGQFRLNHGAVLRIECHGFDPWPVAGLAVKVPAVKGGQRP